MPEHPHLLLPDPKNLTFLKATFQIKSEERTGDKCFLQTSHSILLHTDMSWLISFFPNLLSFGRRRRGSEDNFDEHRRGIRVT